MSAHCQPIVPDHEWQAGLSKGHMTRRAFLNGEPQTGAFAANERMGWVAFWQTDDAGLLPYRLARGYVEIRRCPGERA